MNIFKSIKKDRDPNRRKGAANAEKRLKGMVEELKKAA